MYYLTTYLFEVNIIDDRFMGLKSSPEPPEYDTIYAAGIKETPDEDTVIVIFVHEGKVTTFKTLDADTTKLFLDYTKNCLTDKKKILMIIDSFNKKYWMSKISMTLKYINK